MDSDNYPSMHFSRTHRVQRTRTPHRCIYCGSDIAVGQAAYRNTWMTTDDDRPVTTYEHVACNGKEW